MRVRELTVQTEEVVEQLEKREAVPALGGLDLQSGVHVDGVKGQEAFGVFHHEVRPPRKRLETQHDGAVQKMNARSASGVRRNTGRHQGRRGGVGDFGRFRKSNDLEILIDV